MENNIHQGEQLKQIIKQSGMSIEHVAKRTGFSKMTLFRMFKKDKIESYKLNHILIEVDIEFIKNEFEKLKCENEKLISENQKLQRKIEKFTGTKTGQL